MAQMTGLNFKIQEMAHRIRELREIENYTIAEMAKKTGVTAPMPVITILSCIYFTLLKARQAL